jgi:hypothetical protein
MNMSETPEKKKARLRYDKVCKTAWTDEFHFIKHSRKGNKFAFCEFCRTATECTILRPSEKHFIFSLFYHTIFKVMTTQILYPKCSILRPSEKKRPPPPLPLLVSRVGMYAGGEDIQLSVYIYTKLSTWFI